MLLYKASYWDCKGFYNEKQSQDFMIKQIEHLKALSEEEHTSAIANHVKITGLNIK